MKKNNILAIAIILVSLIGALVLVKDNQDQRKSASVGDENSLYFAPASISGKNQGEEITSGIFLKVSDNQKIDFAQSNVCYKADQLEYKEITPMNNFKIMGTKVSGGCVLFALMSLDKESDLKSGTIQVANIKFNVKTNSLVSDSITIDLTKSYASGLGADPNNLKLTISKTTPLSYSINTNANAGTNTNIETPVTVNTNNSAVVNFKMAFAGVKPGAKCGGGYDIKMFVMRGVGETSNGARLIEKDNIVADGTNVNKFGDQVYKVKTPVLFDFSFTDQLSLFIKGGRHIQMKYGQDKQNGYYTKAMGAISVTRDAATTPLLDFSDHPNLPGDINQDGKINAIDYGIIKNNLLQTGEPGNIPNADLNGDCQVNSGDTQLFKNSLIEKQDQLY